MRVMREPKDTQRWWGGRYFWMHSREKRCVLRAAGCGSLFEIQVRMLFAVGLVFAVLGCAPDVVIWEEPQAINSPSPDSRLTLTGRTALFIPTAVPVLPVPPAAGACPGSVRTARAEGRGLHAVWWSVRADSSVALLAARSMDGGATWRGPVPVDTTDVGGLGCARLPPAIAVDAATGYIHVVYFLETDAGAGIFFSHSMERGELYHAPIAIVYGERPSSADVAAHASRVVVGYEDPNLREQSPGKIALAISRSDGHIFEHRVPVTPGGAPVSSPRVAIEGDHLAVAWIKIGDRGTFRRGRLNSR